MSHITTHIQHATPLIRIYSFQNMLETQLTHCRHIHAGSNPPHKKFYDTKWCYVPWPGHPTPSHVIVFNNHHWHIQPVIVSKICGLCIHWSIAGAPQRWYFSNKCMIFTAAPRNSSFWVKTRLLTLPPSQVFNVFNNHHWHIHPLKCRRNSSILSKICWRHSLHTVDTNMRSITHHTRRYDTKLCILDDPATWTPSQGFNVFNNHHGHIQPWLHPQYGCLRVPWDTVGAPQRRCFSNKCMIFTPAPRKSYF